MSNKNIKYKAIFTDLDGTLLNSQKTITPKTLEPSSNARQEALPLFFLHREILRESNTYRRNTASTVTFRPSAAGL